MSLKFDISQLANSLIVAPEKVDAAVWGIADNGAQKIENYAKVNARWKNHTTNARTRLKGYNEPLPKGRRIILSHGVDYGIWLELAHEKKYAIIMEAINTVGANEIMPAFKKVMERLRRL